jgi:small subunit ribosomal protein S21
MRSVSIFICIHYKKVVILLKYYVESKFKLKTTNVKKQTIGIIYFLKSFEKTFSISNFAPRLKTELLIMIIVPLKEGENIERALKKFKRKFEKTGVIRELRSRQAFIKPSVRRREEIKKAMYVQKMQESEE